MNGLKKTNECKKDKANFDILLKIHLRSQLQTISPQTTQMTFSTPVNSRVKLDNWYLGELLSAGTFSFSFKGINKKNGKTVMLKLFNKSVFTDEKCVKRNIDCLSHINNKHIVKLIACNLQSQYPIVQ